MLHHGILEKEPGTLWCVWFPDGPGCVPTGETADEATRNAAFALSEHLAGISTPTSCNLDTLLEAPDVIEALKQGGILVRVPCCPDETAIVRLNVTFERDVLAAIDGAASAHGMSCSAFIAAAAMEKVRAGA